MAALFLEFDLTREIDQLQREPRPASGQNAKTLAKHDDFRIVLITLDAHARIPDHRAEGRISIHTIRGHIRMRALERTFDLRTGGLLVLALEDSALLLTIAWPGRDGSRAGSR
jgi:quercetin dioxygenase-like cupin family protein